MDIDHLINIGIYLVMCAVIIIAATELIFNKSKED